MAETTQFTIGVVASCSDGTCGAVSRVVVDPVARTVTHIVVEPKHREGLGRLVPLSLVDATPDQVRLRCTKREFEHLDRAEERHFLPGSIGYANFSTGQALSWPYYALGGGIGTAPQVATYDTVPLGEVMVRRNEQVHATDGEIGRVQGLVVTPDDHRVTHVLLQEGHVWGRKEVAIPIGAVSGVDDGIRLTMTKQEVQDLPPVDIERPGEQG
jgi:sporulation protein YlmC with PRC-barrel domain